MLISNIKKRPQKNIFRYPFNFKFTTTSAKEPLEYSEQDTEKFQTTIKVDGHLVAKGV